MRSTRRYWVLALASSMLALAGNSGAATRTFSDDVAFLRKYTEIFVLGDAEGQAQIAVAPAWQGRVMTSTAELESGRSFGWINREFIAAGKRAAHINAFGGEDRFWLGPEGSQYSIYFAPGGEFEGANWYVPAPLDTLPFQIVRHAKDRAVFRSEFALSNYSGTGFQVVVEREIRLLDKRTAWQRLGLAPPGSVALVAYESNNILINAGHKPWRKETGLLSIWILGMLNASPSTTVVVPIQRGTESELGARVTPYQAYGIIPPERLQATQNAVFFRGDAKRRGKIGVGPRRALGKIGSYDADRHVLTIVQFSQPRDARDYVNSLWGTQGDPYAGDAINAYNDGPPAAGEKSLGPFFELESSSPAAALDPGEKLTHTHRTFHLTGSESQLDAVARRILGVSLAQIHAALPHDQ
jgi:hypothetical protein